MVLFSFIDWTCVTWVYLQKMTLAVNVRGSNITKPHLGDFLLWFFDVLPTDWKQNIQSEHCKVLIGPYSDTPLGVIIIHGIYFWETFLRCITMALPDLLSGEESESDPLNNSTIDPRGNPRICIPSERASLSPIFQVLLMNLRIRDWARNCSHNRRELKLEPREFWICFIDYRKISMSERMLYWATYGHPIYGSSNQWFNRCIIFIYRLNCSSSDHLALFIRSKVECKLN